MIVVMIDLAWKVSQILLQTYRSLMIFYGRMQEGML